MTMEERVKAVEAYIAAGRVKIAAALEKHPGAHVSAMLDLGEAMLRHLVDASPMDFHKPEEQLEEEIDTLKPGLAQVDKGLDDLGQAIGGTATVIGTIATGTASGESGTAVQGTMSEVQPHPDAPEPAETDPKPE